MAESGQATKSDLSFKRQLSSYSFADSFEDLFDENDDVSAVDSHFARGESEEQRLEEEVKAIVRPETRSLQAFRIIILLFILITGAVVATVSYLFMSNEQDKETLNKYYLHTNTIATAFDFQIKNLFKATRDVSEMITSEALMSNQQFPFVTIPNIEVIGSHARELAGIEVLVLTPYVPVDDANRWLNYSQTTLEWIDASLQVVDSKEGISNGTKFVPGPFSPYIFTKDSSQSIVPSKPPYYPIWQTSPPPHSTIIFNFNMYSEPFLASLYDVVGQVHDAVFSEVSAEMELMTGTAVSRADHIKFHEQGMEVVDIDTPLYHPHSVMMMPLFDEIGASGKNMVGTVSAVVGWDVYFANLLQDGVSGIIAVLRNTCGQAFTYELVGPKARRIGMGDLHDPSFDFSRIVVPLHAYFDSRTEEIQGHCVYSIDLYSSNSYNSGSSSSKPVVITVVVASIFFGMILAFIVYDRIVYRRNRKMAEAAVQSNAILSSLFPNNVRDRLMAQKQLGPNEKATGFAPKNRLQHFLDGGGEEVGDLLEAVSYSDSKPIADLFTETTVMFGDIVGFTAWSSVREPAQVFLLLETLYRAFDRIAKKRRVFKVETIGDCYVAVAGLPEPRRDHALAMTRFARDCLMKMRSLTKDLEVTLGPDTGDLCMRVGLHSGPVTAGVLRGERARFQLFGDTMNTAARMESTGKPDRIQISQETADLLIAGGKSNWIQLRHDKVHAKGKGEMQTYWVTLVSDNLEQEIVGVSVELPPEQHQSHQGNASFHDSTNDETNQLMMASKNLDMLSSPKMIRLIDWNADVLARLLRAIIARRKATHVPRSDQILPGQVYSVSNDGLTPIDEVKEIIVLPKFSARAAQTQERPDAIELPGTVLDQLQEYVSNIAALYRDNPFHNFEHASHVTMSVVKLLSRIVAPSDVDFERRKSNARESRSEKTKLASTLHDHTYGITSDPLTQFACVFSALIHDVDHSGVPNAQLVKDKVAIAAYYKEKSIAEQNSVDLAWNLLMEERFSHLRAVIYTTEAEQKRFRQLVVNSVMATDIVDKELKALRNQRWERAFSNQHADLISEDEDINRKATIVIEHLIQASDVAHTMQHWHIYRKWNERFFMECYLAYKQGRADKDPAEYWYNGELGFFDFYIIPLAKKLKDCGVFGVSSDEYLNYAERNRKEWEERGREVVDEMIEAASMTSNTRATERLPPMDRTPISSPERHDNTAGIA